MPITKNEKRTAIEWKHPEKVEGDTTGDDETVPSLIAMSNFSEDGRPLMWRAVETTDRNGEPCAFLTNPFTKIATKFSMIEIVKAMGEYFDDHLRRLEGSEGISVPVDVETSPGSMVYTPAYQK